jgi:hypothetical protein
MARVARLLQFHCSTAQFACRTNVLLALPPPSQTAQV